MRLLVIGLGNSPHLVDTVAQLKPMNWDVHVVTSIDAPWAGGYERCTIHHTTSDVPPEPRPGVEIVDHREEVGSLGSRAWPTVLAHLIAKIQPDIIHAHELQHSGVLALNAMRRCSGRVPLFVLSTWGSDIYHFARQPDQRVLIRAVLRACDVVWPDCWRDQSLARSEGFRGTVLPATPVGGGYDIVGTLARRSGGPTSARRDIAVKGFNTWVGRGMNALDAVEMCGDLLAGRQLFLLTSDDETEEKAARLCTRHGATLRVLRGVPKETIFSTLRSCRVSLALNMSDGTSKGFLEALLCGAFPIQSFSSAAGEWTTHEESAFLVDPTDIRAVASALRRALTDDELVDHAREINDVTVRAHLDARAVGCTVLASYRKLGGLANVKRAEQIETSA